MRSTIRRTSAITAVVLLLAACGGGDDDDETTASADDGAAASEQGAPPETSAALDALIEEAKAEDGELALNWGYTGIPESIDALEAAFNERFDLDVDIQYTAAVSMPANFGALAEEAGADRPASSDAFLGTYTFSLEGGTHGADIFEVIDWKALAPEWPDGVVASDGTAVSLLHQIFGFAYNTNEFSEDELPETVDDVIEIARERPIASTPYAAGFNLLATDDLLGEEATLDHVSALGDVQKGLIGCNDVDRIASGEFVGFWMNCGSNIIDQARETRGAPVASVVLADAAVTQPWMISIPKNSAHPKTATLWTYFLLTEEAQDILYENGYADNMLLDGSGTAEEIAEIENDGIEFVHQDYEYGIENPIITDRGFNEQLIGALTGQAGG